LVSPFLLPYEAHRCVVEEHVFDHLPVEELLDCREAQDSPVLNHQAVGIADLARGGRVPEPYLNSRALRIR
jgi:hypothetical protein